MSKGDSKGECGSRRGHRKPKTGQFETTAPPAVPTEQVRGWILLAHPLFLDQLERLTANAATEDSGAGKEGPATKLLAHVLDLVFEKIPQNPASAAYRHGGALGGANREWFRAKTGNGRFRLFFRFSTTAKVIIFAWLNDEHSLRTYGSSTDAYAVFTRMLNAGNPPTSWAELYAAAATKRSAERLRRATRRHTTRDPRDG